MSVRILKIESPCGFCMTETVVDQTSVSFGRSDSAVEDQIPGVSFNSDMRVSRRHGRLWQEGGDWFIEDLGSKHGTMVAGRDITGCGRVRFLPGTPVRAGDTLWTAVPADWLFLRQGPMIIFGPCVKAINYAAYHCGVPLAGPFTVRNVGAVVSSGVVCSLQVVGVSGTCRMNVARVDSGCAVTLPPAELRLSMEYLRSVVEPHRTKLIAQIEGGTQISERDIHVLGPWDWSYSPSLWTTLTAFVSPRNPIVQRIVIEAAESLQSQNGIPAFDTLLRSDREDAERLCLHAIFDALRDRRQIRYIGPKEDEIGMRLHYQRIRPPQHIFPDSGSSGSATCLDLAVLMAACLEHVGLMPLIFLLGENRQAPSHAFAACWVGPTPGARTIVEDIPRLRRDVSAGRMIVVETTGVAEGFRASKLSFEEAVTSATRRLEETRWGAAVDVGAARHPYGDITPMDSPYDAEVARAYDEALTLAKAKRRELEEMAHLLYGLLAAKGKLTVKLCQQMGVQLDIVLRRLADALPVGDCPHAPFPTRNSRECQRMADDLAWHGGSPSVREQDLLWALLLKSPDSRSLQDTAAAVGLDLTTLASALSRIHPRPGAFASSMPLSSKK